MHIRREALPSSSRVFNFVFTNDPIPETTNKNPDPNENQKPTYPLEDQRKSDPNRKPSNPEENQPFTVHRKATCLKHFKRKAPSEKEGAFLLKPVPKPFRAALNLATLCRSYLQPDTCPSETV
jgi:hypothetical protein